MYSLKTEKSHFPGGNMKKLSRSFFLLFFASALLTFRLASAETVAEPSEGKDTAAAQEESAEQKQAPAPAIEQPSVKLSNESAMELYLKAVTCAENELKEEAIKIYSEILNSHKGTWWAELSALKLASVNLKSGSRDEGVKLLEGFITDYPESLLLEKARLNLCTAYVIVKENEKAKEALKAFIDSYPKSPYLDEAKKLLNQIKDSKKK